MATAPTYITHAELKRIFPQLDEFDQKTPIYGWKEVTSNKYAAHDSGQVTQLFADGEDLGPAQSAHTDLNVEGEWFYNSAEDVCYYYSASTPSDKLMEGGEEFVGMVTQYRADASRYFDSRVDPSLPREQLKDKSGNYDYMVIRSVGLIAAAFMIKTKDHKSELALSFMEEADKNIELLNEGKAALSWQNTADASQGLIRDITYTSGKIRPVDTRGNWNGTWDLIKVKIGTGGVLGTATYNVYTKDSDGLKQNQVVTNEKITGDFQPLAGSLQIRFAGDTDTTQAAANDEWEIEVTGQTEYVDSSDMKAIKLTRSGTPARRYYK
ncbi:MAG: hypothetical protein GOVbin212_11 [Prokaryotic dsDNA virus sp.]|nr:MAG: hypothetical protein GOVbin212_11 [Prokaryotic dsDNA virus sp.]|tara:strand:+ start:1614 stop:2585 length:972 start_codon:yes stop_codon:yes gene_type:complete